MLKHWFFNKTFGTFLLLLSKLGNGKYIPHFLQLISPVFLIKKDNKKFLFWTPNPLTRSRGETLFTKEPETIEWIDTFEEVGVFYDIGANVGVYTIYAGVTKPNLKVFSFEPTFFNYWLLNKNIYLNNLDSKISAFCVALSNANVADYIYMPEIQDGGAMVNFGSNLDYNKEKFRPAFKQGSLAFSLDSFISIFKIPVPDYIKIDVDGLENEIVHGALETLKNPKVKSILIELNEAVPADMELLSIITSCGFVLKYKKQGSGMARDSKFALMHNYIFVRA